MSNKTWKNVERRIASFFKTKRNPLSGQNSRHTGADILHDKLFVEVKMRKQIPFLKLFKETSELAKKENKIPVVVFVEKGSRTPILMCNLYNLKELREVEIDDKP